jgi:hypothetical protein
MKLIYLNLLIISGLFAVPWSMQSQVVIKGIILDEYTSIPIPNSHIYEESRGKAVVSDSAGVFEIEVPALPVLLSVSHLSYYPKAVIVDHLPVRNIEIRLTLKDFQINEVVVTAEKVQQFFRREGFFVKEMEFGEGFMWVIGYPGKNILKPELRVLSLGGSVIAQLDLTRSALLYKDALGEVHLNYQDSLCQLKWEGDSIRLVNTFVKDGTEEYFFNLQASYDSLAIIKRHGDTGVFNEYLVYNFLDSSQQIFHYSFDHELFASEKYAKNHKYGTIPDIIFPSFSPGISARLSATFDPSDDFTRHAQKRLLTYTPINSRLFKMKDHLIIFEDKGPFIWKYGLDLVPLGMETIQVPDKSHKLDLLQDPLSHKLFLAFENNARQYISELDENTGKIQRVMRLKGFTFVENVSVYGNRVYFLDQSRAGSQTMNLYSMAIE